jgi:putative hydrolase of the HAD superfamily
VSRYRHIFFDLDHTLWDFRTNSRAVLHDMYAGHGLRALGVPDAETFVTAYEEVNERLWARYEAGRMHRDVLRVLRFRDTLALFGVRDDGLADRMGHAYLELSPNRRALMPGAADLLNDLGRDHKLHIITNGFHEVQVTKLASSGIARCFQVVLTSEQAKARKPDPRIFARALKEAGARAEESLMVGDDVRTDMGGARNAGWDHAHFAPEGEPDPLATYRVRSMAELRSILL